MAEQPNPPIKVYTASPGGFAESTRGYHHRLVRMLREQDFIVLNPWELTPQSEVEKALAIEGEIERKTALRDMDCIIATRNIHAIRTTDIILATLDGQEVDSGTACEMGMGFSLGKAVFGLRSDFRQSGENDGCTVNMQVEHCIHASGGILFTSLREVRDKLHLLVMAGLLYRERRLPNSNTMSL